MVKKRTLEIFGTVLALIGCLTGVISLFVFFIYPSYLEKPQVKVISVPTPFGVYSNWESDLGITLKSVGRAHFVSCIKLVSEDPSIQILRDYDCYEFFNKGETHAPQFIVNSTRLFEKSPESFKLTYFSNTGWNSTCLFKRQSENFYTNINCEYQNLALVGQN
jgi:hypothetical protein